MRRFISVAMAVLMLANLAVWPSVEIGEALEHEREVVQLADGQGQPNEPSPAHCQHEGHCGQHFQGQVSVIPTLPRLTVSESVVAAFEDFSPQHVPTLPFRPPLTATIRS